DRYTPAFALALGDDRTDEVTFRAMPPEAYTIRVGTGARSLARKVSSSVRSSPRARAKAGV
ncbi:MAG: hypothetical protein EOO57_08910, partial [Hymenobacter sp.]